MHTVLHVDQHKYIVRMKSNTCFEVDRTHESSSKIPEWLKTCLKDDTLHRILRIIFV